MLLLHRDGRRDGATKSRLVLLFGCGLIGREVAASLGKMGFKGNYRPFDWLNPGLRAEQASDLLSAICKSDHGATECRPGRVDFIWSAGRAGFAAGEAQLAAEMACFEDVIGIADATLTAQKDALGAFHLVSSAGGLFEGQTGVGHESTPHPRRPYGASKLAMESVLSHAGLRASIHTYRPTTVYGVPSPGLRSGLLATLLVNGLRRRETRLYGQMDTLRDYVINVDVGRFISSQVTTHHPISATHLLASGRPSSLYEVKCLAERVIGRKIYAVYDPSTDNAANITFGASGLPNGWRPLSLEQGLRAIHRGVLAI